jgi:APA family basic amino acid/polyamine antiporter
MKKFNDLGPISRFVAPVLAGTGSLYIIWGAIQKDMFLHFFLLSLAIILAGLPFMRQKQKSKCSLQ